MSVRALIFRFALPAIVAASLSASSFDQLVVFGDSLSDTGNVSIATGGLFPGANYAPGRFSNGPIWVDQLAARLGVADPQPVLALNGGTNYAFASANTGSNGLYNISDQLGLYALNQPGGASANALFTIWGGANDLFNSANAPAVAAANLAGNIQALAAGGAKTFLWANLPPLGSTPRAAADNDAAALTAATLAFNQAWASDLVMLRGMGINVIGLDIYSLFGSIAANPSLYGFTNVTNSAQGLSGIDPNTYLFWDAEHPTTAGHGAVANLAYNDVTAVPEPMTGVATLVGLAFTAAIVRARKAQLDARRLRLQP